VQSMHERKNLMADLSYATQKFDSVGEPLILASIKYELQAGASIFSFLSGNSSPAGPLGPCRPLATLC
jgi:hypothetical protein